MAKYSFEATTVGEMLDTPEIMELINKYIPAVLEHPLLEVGRSFIFNDAPVSYTHLTLPTICSV